MDFVLKMIADGKKETIVSKRVWLNDEDSPSTGYVAYYHGIFLNGMDHIYLRVSDCTRSITIYSDDYGSSKIFLKNLQTIIDEIDKFRESLDTSRTYTSRKWLKSNSKEETTSYIECRHIIIDEEEKVFLKIGHRDRLIKLHAIEEDSLENFKKKLEVLSSTIKEFWAHLKNYKED